MSFLRIPQDLQEGFKNLISLDESAFNSLWIYISEIRSIGSVEEYKTNISDFLFSNGIDEGKIPDIIISLVSLKVKYPEREIAEDLFLSYNEINGGEIDESLFYKRVNILVANNGALVLFFKRNLLKSYNERTYLESEIITDVRFIFDTELTSKNRNAIILHNLRLKIDSSKGDDDIYVSLDLEHLKELKACVERAILKEEIIKGDYSDIIFI